MTVSKGGIGLDTAEMVDPNTYLQAGWDVIEETANGTSNYWKLIDGEYPSLFALSSQRPTEPAGSGSIEDPYLITNVLELGSIWYRPYAHYRLAGNIDISEIRWGMAVVPWFGGTFEGGDFPIHLLNIEGRSSLGLFGVVTHDAEIRQVELNEIMIKGTYGVGTIANINEGLISMCRVSGVLQIESFSGGLASFNAGRIESCETAVAVSAPHYSYVVGGVVGSNIGEVRACTSTGSVHGGDQVGGIAGVNRERMRGETGILSLCCSSGSVRGRWIIGGLVGMNEEAVIQSSYSSGSVYGEWGRAGGLVGTNDLGTIVNSYSTGDVESGESAGGLVGQNGGHVDRCYSTGPVRGGTGLSGLVAIQGRPSATATASYWDMESSGLTHSDGGTGLTTAEMQTASPFLDAGWDFIGETENGTEDIWWILEGQDYPRLWWELEEEASD